MTWTPPVDGQTIIVGSTLVATDEIGANGFPVMSGSPGTPVYSVIMPPALFEVAWAQYQTAPPLSRVYSGDDPANPTQTIELQFADEPTAQAALASLVIADQASPGGGS
jgi:hypothetical protein